MVTHFLLFVVVVFLLFFFKKSPLPLGELCLNGGKKSIHTKSAIERKT